MTRLPVPAPHVRRCVTCGDIFRSTTHPGVLVLSEHHTTRNPGHRTVKTMEGDLW